LTKIDVASAFKAILDQLAKDPSLAPYNLLFPNDSLENAERGTPLKNQRFS
jgi:hypothetical protein